MRLVFINRFFFPDPSATSQMLTELAEDLCTHGQMVTVITGRNHYLGGKTVFPPRQIYKGIDIRRVGATNFGRRQTLGRLVDYLSFYLSATRLVMQMNRPDCLVVLTDPPLLSVLGSVMGILKRIRIICWLQDVFPEIAVRSGSLPNGFLALMLQRLAVWSIRNADKTVVLGRCMERHLLACGIPASRLVQIPNWADGSKIVPMNRQENRFLDEYKLQNRFVVMYSGNFGVVHECGTMQTMIRIMKSEQRICFCFVGEGSQKRHMVEVARQEEWDHVVFLPYQAKENLRFSLAAGDVHLVSLRPDMVGLSVPSKIYGILAAGRPIVYIGPKDSEVAEIIRDADCGFIIPSGDGQRAANAVGEYYRNSDLRDQHGRRARRYFERHCDRLIATDHFWHVLKDVSGKTA